MLPHHSWLFSPVLFLVSQVSTIVFFSQSLKFLSPTIAALFLAQSTWASQPMEATTGNFHWWAPFLFARWLGRQGDWMSLLWLSSGENSIDSMLSGSLNKWNHCSRWRLGPTVYYGLNGCLWATERTQSILIKLLLRGNIFQVPNKLFANKLGTCHF